MHPCIPVRCFAAATHFRKFVPMLCVIYQLTAADSGGAAVAADSVSCNCRGGKNYGIEQRRRDSCPLTEAHPTPLSHIWAAFCTEKLSAIFGANGSADHFPVRHTCGFFIR